MKDDVLRFEISMYDLTFMHVVQGSTDLLDYDLGQILGQLPLFLEQGVQLSRRAQLLNQIDGFLIAKKGVQFNDVGVVEKGLYFYFSAQLHYHLLIHI